MGFLDPPIVFSVEIHIPASGVSSYYCTPRDVTTLSPETRIAIGQHLEAQMDHVLGLLGLMRRYEVVPGSGPLSVDDARKVLG